MPASSFSSSYSKVKKFFVKNILRIFLFCYAKLWISIWTPTLYKVPQQKMAPSTFQHYFQYLNSELKDIIEICGVMCMCIQIHPGVLVVVKQSVTATIQTRDNQMEITICTENCCLCLDKYLVFSSGKNLGRQCLKIKAACNIYLCRMRKTWRWICFPWTFYKDNDENVFKVFNNNGADKTELFVGGGF